MPLCVSEKCFWTSKTRKNLVLFEMHTCLWPYSQIWFRHKWRKLVTASLLLLCIDWYSCFRYWIEFFFSCVSGWSFLVLHFDGNVCNWTPKVIWQRMDWFWVFLGYGFFLDLKSVSTEMWKNCSIVNRFWPHEFFRCLVWEIFWFVL